MSTNSTVTKFGRIIQTIRKQRKLTLEIMSADIGIDAAHLSRIERGQKEITLSTAAKIAKALDLELSLGTYKLI